MIYCCGLTSLLYVAACESLIKEPITFVHYANMDLGKLETQESRIVRDWALFISQECSICIDWLELKSRVRPSVQDYEDSFYKLPNWVNIGPGQCELPSLSIYKGDTIADNLLNIWSSSRRSSITKGKPINIIGHGAGTLNIIPGLNGNSFLLINHLRTIRKIYSRHKIKNIFLYNGVGQQISKFLPWYLVKKVQFIDSLSLNRLCRRLSEKLMNQYPIISEILRIERNITLYAPTVEVSDNDYASYLEKQVQEYPFEPDSTFVIKNHPRDQRDYRKYFDQLGLKTISLSSMLWRNLPLEIILNVNPEFRYMGAYSSAMVTIETSRCYVYMPAKDEVVNFYQSEYSALIKSLR